eukprot:Tamp_36488.p2 GENE.Tamp_36488~~Tamp_36488.p2  ORF type:complete len:183 (+),score=9.85 Tamp_36488:84-551(+)
MVRALPPGDIAARAALLGEVSLAIGSSHARPRTPMRLATEFSPLGVSECLSALAIFELQVRGSVNASPSSWVSECLSALAIFELQVRGSVNASPSSWVSECLSALAIFELQVRARLTACPSSDREEEEEASDEPSSSLCEDASEPLPTSLPAPGS